MMKCLIIITLSVVSIFVARCSADLINQADYGNSVLKYYNRHSDYVNIAGALSKCWQRGGWLVMPKDRNINSAILAVTSNVKAWVGVGDLGVEGAYEFIDGTELVWSNWDTNQHTDFEDCVQLRKEGWHDYECDLREGYVCQIPNSQSFAFDHSHLMMHEGDEAATYNGAIAVCETFGSRLVRISNEHHIQKLQEVFPQLAEMPSWISKQSDRGVDDFTCNTISYSGVGEDNCNSIKSFICEAVEPHKVVVSEETPEVFQTSDLQIHCSAYGFPTPEVAWFRNDVEVRDQMKLKGHSSMKLHEVTSADNGLYVCRATNVINGEIHKMEGYSFVKVIGAGEEQKESM